MHIGKVDLNLYRVLDAIYREGSISRAGHSLNLTQPAVSHALARLRDVYGDQLFVRGGNRMVPTPLTRSIIQPVREALSQLQTTLTTPQPFDPATNTKGVVLGMRDVAESVILPQLVMGLTRSAPRMQITSVRVPRREMETELASGRLDLAFDVLLPVGADISHRELMEDQFVVVSRRDHPDLKEGLDIERYLRLRHIIVSSRRSGPAVEDFELGRLGHHRTIGMRCQNYSVAWKTVAGSDMLLTLPSNYVRWAEQTDPLVTWPVPAELKPLASYMYWHSSLDEEPANCWLRDQVLTLYQSLGLSGEK